MLPPASPKFANRISRSPLHRPAGRIRTSHGKHRKSCVLLSLSSPPLKDVSSPLTPLSWLLLAYDGVHLSLSLSLSCPSSCKPVFILVFGTLVKSSIYNEASKGAFSSLIRAWLKGFVYIAEANNHPYFSIVAQ